MIKTSKTPKLNLININKVYPGVDENQYYSLIDPFIKLKSLSCQT